MPPNRLLQQYVFHMTTTTGDNTLQASQNSSNGRVQQAKVADSWFTLNNFTDEALYFALSIHVHWSLWIRSASSYNRHICIFPPKSLVPAPSRDCFLSYFSCLKTNLVTQRC
ncbi:hypothetical protein AVEN_29571-1 [Araneus ventricosus]|uniref:Uncharacterized protein n=1 Tax=Araneus ventricosus TaxID=182803 RepID=A0A4Y2M4D2_ARAVE|nr:hypothetical protein AVEN_29571-1 [Araneus ventricosus]